LIAPQFLAEASDFFVGLPGHTDDEAMFSFDIVPSSSGYLTYVNTKYPIYRWFMMLLPSFTALVFCWFSMTTSR
jgi:hypothetical protein